jgi:hypothetical protein
MIGWLKSLDRILRGEATRPDSVQDGDIDFQLFGLTIVIVVLAMIYGVCMGTFSLFKEVSPEVGLGSDRYWQILASTVKVPALFLLTLIVTFPSLYVFNALVGSRLNLTAMLKLLIASLAVNLAVLASLGPITAFFSVSTTSYRFMQIFNVGMFSIAGMLGLLFLNQTLNRMSAGRRMRDGLIIDDHMEANVIEAQSAHENGGDDDAKVEPVEKSKEVDLPKRVGAIDRTEEHVLSRHVTIVFRIWVVAFCFVGAQMGWVLRPFIGNPEIAFTWFRERQSNFFEAILDILGKLISG